jgi:hypothetical protein
MSEGKDNIHSVAGKREFLKNYLNSVRDELISKADQMPEEWDGHELRWLVADKFEWEQSHRKGPIAWRKRVRDYTNERLTRNL